MAQRSGSGARLQYSGPSAAPTSALTLLSDALVSNETYEFMVQLESMSNASAQATGYLLVHVRENDTQLVVIG